MKNGAILVTLKYPLRSTPLLPPRHLLNLHLMAYHTVLLLDRLGWSAWTPSGSRARFYYIGFLMRGGGWGSICIFYMQLYNTVLVLGLNLLLLLGYCQKLLVKDACPPSHQKPLGWCNRTWCRILKGSEHTAHADPTAKLCAKQLDIDITNYILFTRGGGG